jgi:predicted permease
MLVLGILADLRYVLRRLGAAPAFTVAAVLTLALGITVNIVLFTAVNSVLWKPLNVVQPDTLVIISKATDHEVLSQSGLEPEWVQQLTERHPASVNGIGGFASFQAAAGHGGGSMVMKGEAVIGNYFGTLGIQPRIGRLLSAADDTVGAPGVMVISERMWKTWFHADPSALGMLVSIGNLPLTIVGVVPGGFQGLHGGQLLGNDVWIPRTSARGLVERDTVFIFARLQPSQSLQSAGAELSTITGVDARARRLKLTAVPFSSVMGDQPAVLVVMGGAVLVLSGLVLLIACGNLLGLLTARMSRRTGEFAIRLTLGADRRRLIQLVTVEMTVLSVLGGAAGFTLGIVGGAMLAQVPVFLGGGLRVHMDPNPDWRLYVYAFALVATAIWGFSAALSTKAAQTDALLSTSSVGGIGPSTWRGAPIRSRVVSVQIAASIILLVTASTFVRSTIVGQSLEPGFQVSGTVVGWISHRIQRHDQMAARRVEDDLLDRLGATPGVTNVSLASRIPGMGGLYVRVRAQDSNASVGSDMLSVSPGFFSTVRLPLISGRDFPARPDADGPSGVIISESLAGVLWPQGNPLGRFVVFTDDDRGDQTARVVGVAADSGRRGGRPSDRRVLFVPLHAYPATSVAVIVRGPEGASRLVEVLRESVRRVHPEVALHDVATLSDAVGSPVAGLRAAATLLTVLGALGGVIAIVGVYGVVAYMASERRREFGIMLALGATHRHLYLMTAREASRLLVTGIVPGTCVAAILVAVLRHYVQSLQPHPLLFVCVPLALLVIAMAASILPVGRILRREANACLRQV